MMQINIGDHVSPVTGYIPFPLSKRDTMRWARLRARRVARGMPSANTYFKTLPGGRSLQQLLDDRTIWINYHATMTDYGETDRVGGKEIAISKTAFDVGRWTVLATLIHELAHSNGAGLPPSRAAEEALLHCGLGRRSEKTSGVDDPRTPYDPSVEG